MAKTSVRGVLLQPSAAAAKRPAAVLLQGCREASGAVQHEVDAGAHLVLASAV
jgi:hypothetical protein